MDSARTQAPDQNLIATPAHTDIFKRDARPANVDLAFDAFASCPFAGRAWEPKLRRTETQ
jgi:hypothetical protein